MVCSIVPGYSCGGSVGRGGGGSGCTGCGGSVGGLLLEVGFQNPSAQQAELPTAHCEVAQPSVYAVHHCSHNFSPITTCNLHSNRRLHDFHFPFPFPSWVQLSCYWNGQPH